MSAAAAVVLLLLLLLLPNGVRFAAVSAEHTAGTTADGFMWPLALCLASADAAAGAELLQQHSVCAGEQRTKKSDNCGLLALSLRLVDGEE